MKNLIILKLFLFFWILNASAQEYKIKFPSGEGRKAVITMDNSKVSIEGYDGDEVIITTSHFEVPPKRADGLKPLYNTAVDNSGVGLAVSVEKNVLQISKASRQDARYTIKLPKKCAVTYQEVNWQGDGLTINNIDGELEVSTNTSEIILTNVSGPVVANSVSGDITVVYSNLNQNKPTSISAVSGFIDVTLPATTKANLKMKSISGEIYSGMDVAMDKSSSKGQNLEHVGGGDISGTVNGGGVEILLSAISSDIYLRKK